MFRIALVIGLLGAVGPFAIDMYLPALPVVAANLGASTQAVQLTLTAYFIAFGVSQLVYGPLSDQMGRRLPLLIGLGVFLAGTLGLTPTGFSLAFAINALGFFTASQAAAYLGARYGMGRVVAFAIAGFAATTTTLLLLTLAGLGSLPVIVLMLLMANAFLGLVIPSTMVMALDPHPDIAGLASSLGGTLQMLAGGLKITLAGPFFDSTPLPMIAAIALCGLIAFAAAMVTLRGRPLGARPGAAAG